MGRGQRPAARSAGKRGASKSTSQSKPATESPDEWMYHVDTQQPLNTDVLLKLFNLGAACTKTYGAHKGKDCTQSSACLVGIYTRPNIKALAEASVGTPPSTATVKDVKLAAGLKNLANTCYLNAVIQCLSHIEPLMRATLSADTLADYDVPATFARLLATRFTAVDPQPMVDALKIDKTVQQDAQEFLSLFLALLSDRSQSVSDVIKRDLTGAMLYSRVCGNCNGVSKKTDTYIFLSVPVVKDSTIAACIAASRAPESVVASCDKCHATNVTFTSSVALKSLPRYLFIHFLRFQYDAVTMRRKKVADAVQFEPFVSASAVSGDESDSRTYRLRAVVNHLGASPDNGHYVAHVVDHLGNWHLYDDDEVKESTQFKGFDAGKPLSSKDVYMALYELLDAHEPGDGLLSAIPSPLLDQIRRDEDERERMASDFEMLKADRIKDFTEWETLCEKVFPTNNAALTATRAAEDSEVLTSYFVSSRWLSRLASGAVVTAEGLEKKVSNRDILCRHGRAVYPSASFRVVSPSSWNLLAGVYGSDMALPLLDSMCSECSKEYLQRRQASKDAFDAWACLKSRLDQDPPTWKLGDDVAEDPDDEPVYIAASSLDIVRDQREPPSDAQTDIIDLTAPLLCTHNGLSPDVARRVVTSGCVMALMDYGYRSIRALPCKLVDVCQECTRQNVAAAATTHSVKTFKFRCKRDLQAIAPHDSNRAIFNRDLVKYTKNHAKQWQDKCAKEAQDRDAAAKKEADARAAAEAADKKRVSQQMAVNFVPARGQSKAISVDSNTSPAGSTGVRTPTDSRATSMSASPAVDPSGSPSTEFPGTPSECPPRRVEHFIVPSSWVDRFNHWLEDHSHTAVEVPPKGITCAEFECEHGLSRVGVNDLHPTKRKGGPIGIVLKEETVDLLCSSFDVDKSKLFRLVELNEARLIQPRECTTCVEARRAREDLQWRCFENGTLHLEGKVRKSKKHRVTISSKLTPVAYNMTVAALNAMVCTVLNSEYEIYVSGDYVKLIHNKTVMSDMDSTLESHGIQDGDTVVMEIDEDQWLNADSGWQAIPDSVANEGRHTATFAGSALSGAGVDSGTSSSRVKECPMCTYHNAPHRTVCEMCESLLSA